MDDGFAPPMQAGLHMVENDGHFEIAVSLCNPTDEKLSLHTATGKLFKVHLKEKNGERLWSPATGTMMAGKVWKVDANSTVTQHYDVPNERMAREKAELFNEELSTDFHDEDYTAEDFQQVEPDECGIVHVVAAIPATRNYSHSVTRQYDLRTNRSRNLDNVLPVESREALRGR